MERYSEVVLVAMTRRVYTLKEISGNPKKFSPQA